MTGSVLPILISPRSLIRRDAPIDLRSLRVGALSPDIYHGFGTTPGLSLDAAVLYPGTVAVAYRDALRFPPSRL